MAKQRRKNATGLPPGSLVFTGNQKVEKVQIHYLQYNEEHCKNQDFDNHRTFNLEQDNEHIDWYDIRGIHDTDLIQSIGQTFGLHPLALEDIVDIQQRPKFEEYAKGIMLIFKALTFDSHKKKIHSEQIALYFNKGLVLSFQEDETDVFAEVRQRIKTAKGRIRQKGSDYLAYALTDNLVDKYYIVLDQIEACIERLEDELMEQPSNQLKGQIHHLKKEVIRVRKYIMPVREAVSRFSKTESPFVEESSQLYIRDLYDHTIQIVDSIDTYRDMLNGLQDLYLSEISFKMNQVMQVLTIITTIFVPLSFLAGLYGMNFVNIPELQHPYGYFILLGVMVTIATVLIAWFKRKDWL